MDRPKGSEQDMVWNTSAYQRLSLGAMLLVIFFCTSCTQVGSSKHGSNNTIATKSTMKICTDFDHVALAHWEQPEPGVFHIWPYASDEYRPFQNCGALKLRPIRPHDRVAGESGEGDGANFCFLFRLDGCRHRRVRFHFYIVEDIEKTGVSLVYANPDFPVFSYDGDTWERMDRKSLHSGTEAKEKIIVVEQEFRQDQVYIAYQYPYSNEHLGSYIERIRCSPYVVIEVAGHSTEGRPIRQISITDRGSSSPKKTVWLMGLQHSAETGAGWGLEGLADYLLSDNPIARQARRLFLFKIIPIVNVDSVAEGRGRLHSTNRNLNREWERDAPVAEVASIRKTMDDWIAQGGSIDIIMDVHGFSATCDRHWIAVVLPDRSYPERQAVEYRRLLEALHKHIPWKLSIQEQAGYAAGAAARRFKALSLSIDGFVYRAPESPGKNTLGSYYDQGYTIWPLEEIKSAGGALIKALVEYETGHE